MESKIRIKWFEELDSTNNELLRHIRDYDNLSVVAAVSQTAGRGQRGNRWLSKPGDNLTFSLLLRPEKLPVREVMALTCLATLAVRDALCNEGVPAVIKWPNDIYVGKKKICGMLVENGLDGTDIAWSVIGIGINLNQTEFPGELLNPISLKRLTGRTYELESFLEKVCGEIEKRLPDLASTEGRNGLREAYERDLFQKDMSASYRDLASGKEFIGTINAAKSEVFGYTSLVSSLSRSIVVVEAQLSLSKQELQLTLCEQVDWHVVDDAVVDGAYILVLVRSTYNVRILLRARELTNVGIVTSTRTDNVRETRIVHGLHVTDDRISSAMVLSQTEDRLVPRIVLTLEIREHIPLHIPLKEFIIRNKSGNL